MRQLFLSLSSAFILVGGIAASARAAQPALYLYEGSSCSVAVQNATFRNMIGRREDGDDVFITFDTAESGSVNVDYGLGCYKGQVGNVALSVALAFARPSNGGPGLTRGAHTLADVAAGQLDGFYAHVAHSAVKHGFPSAQMRLGEEMNGNWYLWSAAGKGELFQQAFCHVKSVMQAAEPTAKFTFWANPSTAVPAAGEIPSCADGVAWDQYESIYTIAGAKAEPQRWLNSLQGWWGIGSMASFHGAARHAVPEFGVGALGDDPTFMAELLVYDTDQKAEFMGVWDSDAAYKGRISDGSKPGEALELIKVFGPPALRRVLNGARVYDGAPAPPAGRHVIYAKLVSGGIERLSWGDKPGETLQAIAGGREAGQP